MELFCLSLQIWDQGSGSFLFFFFGGGWGGGLGLYVDWSSYGLELGA